MAKNTEPQVEEVPFLHVGHVYYNDLGTEYYLTSNSRGRVKVVRLSDGTEGSAPERSFYHLQHRAPTEADLATLRKWEEKRAEATKTLVPGQVVKLNDKRALTAAAKTFPGKENGNFVVVKVSEKTVNIVPLGGSGNGLAYLRSPAALLTVVEL